ncbi:hypothetical protein E2P81_ATG04481 [Venturia nashicola]|uniref:N,N-dimethylformamidase beta subunit-like C-terminal domain-containing protein n=1 Tax=Venturia nashicola TaxID=86259 RepID=A0A4Z1PIJ5_9PEZI|nr:hypothetical protein E6O75_ATG04586 [Venturia nashicola]TLD37669.1 hypothetical protein E2P81_ATG04481 [Venturia nashicola]
MTAELGKHGYPPEIIGYAEPWIVAPGDSVAIKVSCTESEYSHRTVRLIQGIDLDHSPKKAEEEIQEIARGRCKGRFQSARPGSYGLIDYRMWYGKSTLDDGIEISLYMQPWLLKCSHAQTLLSSLNSTEGTGVSISLNLEGSLDISVATKNETEVIRTELRPEEKKWSRIKVTITGRCVRMSLSHRAFKVEPVSPPTAGVWQLEAEAQVFGPGPILIAARRVEDDGFPVHSKVHATDFFNGRLDQLKLRTTGPQPLTLCDYDFSLDMSSDRILDSSGYGHHGVLINAPTRAVKGHDWDGSMPDWTRAQFGYGAIHFHDDDLDDAEWETDFTITIPPGARSGAYAVEVDAGLDTDSITFFVRPTRWASDNSSKVCLVFSTFTYLAYANERLYDTTRQNTADLGPGFDINKTMKSAEFEKMRRRTDLGLSCYDRHNDGSGVCFSSSKRPILNCRPSYIMWCFSRPREFSADLMMIGFLEREGIPYEIVTDHDLHARGANALEGFNTVITGCHPEYPTLASFSAYTTFAKRGGNLMYLGGNGFYWVSGHDKFRPHRLEVRRGDQGVRSFGLPGGEYFNSIDGQQGGLWRSRGMSCNTLFGVGFCAQGVGPGVPFKRTVLSREPRLSWMFEGVDGEMIGEFGLAEAGGASGDEIDRFDTGNGSPEGALTLATSTGHSDEFGIAVEDLSFPALNTLGSQTDLIRSDIVYYVGAGGGSVFSVGSINWYCSLAWDDYNNNVAKLTGNVVRGFLQGRR